MSFFTVKETAAEKIKRYETVLDSQGEEIEILNGSIDEAYKANKDLTEEIIDLKSKITRMEDDHKLAFRNNDLTLDIMIAEATASLIKENTALKIDNANYKKESEVLTTAFKNMGFDVKDTKEMMDKLVTGLIEKNKIQVIK